MIFPKRVLVNGRLLDPRRPALSVFDRGFLYGDGVYETVRVYEGKPFHWPDHVRRLRKSAQGLGIRVPFSVEALWRGARKLLAANRLQEAVIRITLTRGIGPLGFDPRPARVPTWVMTAVPAWRPPESFYRTGVRVAVARVRRNPPAALDPALKSTNNINNILAKAESIRRGAFEALMLNIQGQVAEGTISNVFFRLGSALHTPSLSCGILEGVTRSVVLRLARRLGLPVREGCYAVPRLLQAREMFITSTVLEVLPVTTVVDEAGRAHRIAEGRVGPWTEALRDAFRRSAGGRAALPS
jgi:branched-chain amino acid aminotransferase